MDSNGNLMTSGQIGEIVIRGPNVMCGYIGDPSVNEECFADGWFRTGDQGYMDSEGYLYITARLKEIINRGGEKISPREVDEIIATHPAVAQVVTFAMRHRTLGEDVGSAIVLRQNRSVTEREIREFVARRLASFKVPGQVIFLENLPNSPTGKLQRIGLAEKLGLASDARNLDRRKSDYVAPRTTVEQTLATVRANVLNLDRVGIFDDFFQLGGQSIIAFSLCAKIEKILGVRLLPPTLNEAPTIHQLAQRLEKSESITFSSLITVNPDGAMLPFFCVHGFQAWGFLPRYLGTDQPFYGLVQGLDGRRVYSRIETVARHYLSELQKVQPEGPYQIPG